MSQHDDGDTETTRTAVYPHPPADDRQSYEQPSYGQPSYEQPTYSQPSYEQPTYSQPSYEQPSYDRQAYEAYWASQYGAPQYSSAPYASAGRHGKSGGTGGKVALAITGAALVAIIAGTIGGAVGFTAARLTAPAPAIAAPAAPLGADAPSIAADGTIASVAQAVQPSVVQINVGDGEGTGSGFVIREDGYILTNHHVAGGGGALSVTFSDGETAEAELIGSSPGYDLAVIKVAATGLPAVSLGSSGALQVGYTTIAIGSPLGLQGTVTSGIVSALNRPVSVGGNDGQGDTAFINAIQTDAAINPGNSGGPLVDGNGAVIGVNSAIMSMGNGMGGGAGSIGLGFAIPIDTAQRIASELISTGSSSTPIIGVQLAMDYAGPGARVADVSAGGPAAAAGLLTDDVIIALNGVPVQDATDLIVDIRALAPGETVTITVERDGQERTFDLTLAAQE